MSKQFKKKQTVRLGNKSVTNDVNAFPQTQVDYSGFGFHENDKSRAENRRNRRLEEKQVQKGNWINEY